jgi:hypothetical protein
VTEWKDIYNKWLKIGVDPSYAAWKADQWEKRNGQLSNSGIDNDRANGRPCDHLDL